MVARTHARNNHDAMPLQYILVDDTTIFLESRVNYMMRKGTIRECILIEHGSLVIGNVLVYIPV
jgi:hypothetical protein